MNNRERALQIFMRVVGFVAATAIVFVFVPYSVMNAIHEGWLGMGPLPADPITGYLARSTSAFYTLLGGLLILLSFDVQRYRTIMAYLLTFLFTFSFVIFGVDLAEGMPSMWAYGEGPTVLAMAVVGYILWRRAGQTT